MKSKMIRIITVLSIGASLTISSVFAQGDLNPPGAPAPTLKTLHQVEPRVDVMTLPGDASSTHIITNSGSYYLSGNLYVTNTSGVSINATNVILDLGGFHISRASGSGGNGVFVAGGMKLAKVFNGSISGFNHGTSISFTPESPQSCTYENLNVSACSIGIYGGTMARVADCIVRECTAFGIRTFNGSVVRDCTLYGNAGNTVLDTSNSGLIENCILYSNSVSTLISAGDSSVINDCSLFQNTAVSGLVSGNGSVMENCTVYENNVTYAYFVGDDSVARSCVSKKNIGIDAFSYGFFVRFGAQMINCVAVENSNTNAPASSEQGVGIRTLDGSLIKDCTANKNSGDGISVDDYCFVIGNTCMQNGFATADGAGITARGSKNRIEGNTVTINDRGIDVQDVDNFIVKNTASGNFSADFEIVANNFVGTIIAPSNSYAITGGSITGAVGVAPFSFGGLGGVNRDDSWANFSY